MNKPKEGWITGRIFYTAVAAYYWAVTIYLDNLYASMAEMPKGEWFLEQVGYYSYGGRYKYLTQWNLMIQRAYFSMVCVAYLTKSSVLKSLSKFFFSSIVISSSLLVTLLFWIIYAINRDLIFPKFYDEIYPWWVNHSLHSFSAVLSLTELFVFPFPVPQKLRWERLVVLILIISYSVWLPWVGYQSGVWPYKFFHNLNNFQIFIFCLMSAVVCIGLHYVGMVLRTFKWGKYSIRVEYETTNKSD